MLDLRCPMCGTHIPDTGMGSWAGVGPPDGSIPEPPPGAWRQRSKCPSCGHKVVRNPDAETPALTEWRVERPLMHLGGTAIMRSTGEPSGAENVRYGSSHISGGGTITTRGHAVIPERVDVSRPTWDITCTGFGAGIGLAVMGQTGMVIGGAAAYVWGRRRWSKG